MSHPFRFGVVAAYAPSRAMWVTTARQMEALGYSTLLIPDRTSAGTPAAVPALAVAASATSILRVGTYVFCNGYRHPVLLAREVATLDLLTDGRFEFGLGSGVSGAEFEQMGLSFAGAGARVAHLEETIKVVKQLLSEDIVNFRGQHYTISDLKGAVRPVQKPHLPILVAGAGEKSLKLAAREADIIAIGEGGPAPVTLEQKIGWIKEAAASRFADLELAQTIFGLEINDSPVPAAAFAGGWAIPKMPMSIEQAVEYLLERRERYGFSYLQIHGGQMENFAPVVARLAGK